MREDAGLGQRELARLAGVGIGALNKLETGKQRGLSADNLAGVAQALGSTVEELLRHAGEENGDGRPPLRKWPTIEEWLAHDRNLTEVQREALRMHYWSYRHGRGRR